MRRRIRNLCVLLALIVPLTHPKAAEPERYVIYYADSATTDQFKPYDFLVLDSTHHPDLAPLKAQNKLIIGYISLGEVDKSSLAYGQLDKEHLILQQNQNWKESYFVDMRAPLWEKIVLDDLIPAILKQGFDGIFLDTLDNPVDLEDRNPRRYAGMKKAAAHMVQAIRQRYPSIKIMMNRGYGILPDVAKVIDFELGESVYADYNFDTKTYGKVKADDYQEQVRLLNEAKTINPALKVYTLDYAKPTDKAAITNIYQTERANGFIPYVATIGLDEIVDEPGRP